MAVRSRRALEEIKQLTTVARELRSEHHEFLSRSTSINEELKEMQSFATQKVDQCLKSTSCM